ncbi:hypothetical protein [Azospirillum sp. TSO22-1]|uniref:hypothetical protein n=1 Tax=Azospirillum sp. TSO22-1 TaxID=716789 RepID=UPI000D61B133|nr:hypothetical protein [Azospirillum sp. TSO22-1]PWC44822.1 hypothetical protein TSO221_16855 [Azospirillum sp. TSO22-1]
MDPDKLAKVLAMAESEHQGEALSALRAARIMLSRAGMNFRDLADGARPRPAAPSAPPVEPPPPPAKAPPPDELVLGLRRQVGDLEREVASLKRALDKATGELDKQKEEVDRWRSLARETAEKLWDLGKALERRRVRHTSADKRRAILDHLQDPGSAMLSDQEIARRVGASVQVVAHWRRRLAIVGRKVRLIPVQPRGRGLWRPQGARIAPLDLPRRRWAGYAAGVTIAGRFLK